MDDLDTSIADNSEAVKTYASEIDELEDGIKALDKSVEEATEQRKEEHEDFNELMANDAACKELIGVAKNRLNKFYNPKLYKPPPTPVSFVQISEHVQHKQAQLPPPPAEFGTYKKS